MAFSASCAFAPLGAARLRHVGPAAAALAAKRFGAELHQIDGVDAPGQVVGHADHERGFPALGAPTKATTPEPSFALASSARPLSSLAGTSSTARSTVLMPRDVARRSASRAPPPASASALRASPSSRSSLRRSSSSAVTRCGNSDVEVRNTAAALLAMSACAADIAARLRCQRLDAPDAGGHRAFAKNREQADVAEPAHMRAAAQFDRKTDGRPSRDPHPW